jgi:UDP-glucose 4-epimerase
MAYLVTGGAGFIGSHLAESLVARGETVSALDNISTGTPSNLQPLLDTRQVDLYEGSVLDEGLARKLVDKADVVAHLAASVGVKLIVERPLETLTNNIRGTEVVLEACADLGKKVLVASTSEIYGKNANGPLREDADRIFGSPFKARWSYSTSKAVDEILAHAYWRERGTPTIVARLFNCVGPRQTGTYGMVVPRFVRQALAGEDVTVYGTGEQRRCFCHVTDTVWALIGLLDHPDAVGDVFNVGSQHEVSMNELARLVIEMTDSGSSIVHIPYDEAYEEGFEDMERRVPDISKIQSLTGWEPTFTLEETIQDVIDHHRPLVGAGSESGGVTE